MKINIAGFIDSLGIMVKGMLSILAVMVVVWLLIMLVKKAFNKTDSTQS